MPPRNDPRTTLQILDPKFRFCWLYPWRLSLFPKTCVQRPYSSFHLKILLATAKKLEQALQHTPKKIWKKWYSTTVNTTLMAFLRPPSAAFLKKHALELSKTTDLLLHFLGLAISMMHWSTQNCMRITNRWFPHFFPPGLIHKINKNRVPAKTWCGGLIPALRPPLLAHQNFPSNFSSTFSSNSFTFFSPKRSFFHKSFSLKFFSWKGVFSCLNHSALSNLISP